MILSELSLDLTAAHEGHIPFAQQVQHISPTDLHQLTTEVYHHIDQLLAGVNDVTFIPPAAAPDGENEWNLAHVIVHLTASLEEDACLASMLARGVVPGGRAMYETAWESVHSRDQINQRLTESRRISLAYLTAWPDIPNLIIAGTHSWFGPMNATAFHVKGLNHARSHFNQIAELVRTTP